MISLASPLLRSACPGCGQTIEARIGIHPWCANALDEEEPLARCAKIAPQFRLEGTSAMATRREGPFVWVTWLAKLMAGETDV